MAAEAWDAVTATWGIVGYFTGRRRVDLDLPPRHGWVYTCICRSDLWVPDALANEAEMPTVIAARVTVPGHPTAPYRQRWVTSLPVLPQ